MPKKIDRQAKRGEIGKAAMQVFRDKGYYPTKMADIAGAAGIGKGTVYEYFRDKAHILQVEFDRYFEAFRKGAGEVLGRAETPGGRLVALVDFALCHVEDWRAHCSVYMDYFSVARTDTKVEAFSLEEIYGEMRDLLTGLIREGQACGEIGLEFQPEPMADLLLSMYDGVVLSAIFVRQQGSASRIREEAMRLIRKGILAGSTEEGEPGSEQGGG
jgi:AcrR family transcriptional regulator